MAIVKMKRLRLIALAQQRDELLARLLHVGCVEVTEPTEQLADPDWTAFLSRDSSELGAVKANLTSVANALAALKKYAPAKGGLFPKRSEISEEDFFDGERLSAALAQAGEINGYTAQLAQLATQRSRLKAQRESLVPWVRLELPLEQEETQTTLLLLGTMPAQVDLAAVKGELAGAAPLSDLTEVSADREFHYVLLICYRDVWPDAQEVLKPHTFSHVRFKELTGTARENIASLDAALAENAEAKANTVSQLASMGGCRAALQLAQDRLNQEAMKQTAREQGLTDGTMVYLEGWVEAPREEALLRELGRFDLAYELTDPDGFETPPTKLDNPPWMQGINMVTEMYSLPAYDGIDPNPLMFFWYVFFFGFMFADVAYGLIIWAVCVFIRKTYNPKGTMGYMFNLGRWLGLSTAFCGFFVGGFFGDAITVIAENFLGNPTLPGWLQTFCDGIIVSPVNDPMTVLIMAIVIGCVQLIFGQCIHIYMEARDGHVLEGLLDVVPWWILFLGIGALVLFGSPVVIIIGVVALVATQGRHNKGFFGKLFGGISSLYDVTSWLSDVLSYARLMALMLATSVIAMVFNTLAALPGVLLAFILIFVVGHTFNVGVNLIGTYVHAARLQYLEFFNKFYKSGGIPFKPLAYNTKYVDIISREEN